MLPEPPKKHPVDEFTDIIIAFEVCLAPIAGGLIYSGRLDPAKAVFLYVFVTLILLMGRYLLKKELS